MKICIILISVIALSHGNRGKLSFDLNQDPVENNPYLFNKNIGSFEYFSGNCDLILKNETEIEDCEMSLSNNTITSARDDNFIIAYVAIDEDYELDFYYEEEETNGPTLLGISYQEDHLCEDQDNWVYLYMCIPNRATYQDNVACNTYSRAIEKLEQGYKPFICPSVFRGRCHLGTELDVWKGLPREKLLECAENGTLIDELHNMFEDDDYGRNGFGEMLYDKLTGLFVMSFSESDYGTNPQTAYYACDNFLGYEDQGIYLFGAQPNLKIFEEFHYPDWPFMFPSKPWTRADCIEFGFQQENPYKMSRSGTTGLTLAATVMSLAAKLTI